MRRRALVGVSWLSALVLGVLLILAASPVGAEVVQHGNTRIGLSGSLAPKRLPRSGTAPIEVSVGARISGVGGAAPPLLRRIQIAINSHAVLDRSGLPVCTYQEIEPTTDLDAMRACGSALVGEGRFSAQVGLGAQAPFPASGKLLAFNGIYEGAPAILAHVYGTVPVPTSYTLPFVISPGHGTWGTVLTATVGGAAGDSGYITGLSLHLGRDFTDHGARRSYLSAGCPAPRGFPAATFPFVRTIFAFAGGTKLTQTLTRSCKVGR